MMFLYFEFAHKKMPLIYKRRLFVCKLKGVEHLRFKNKYKHHETVLRMYVFSAFVERAADANGGFG